MNAVTLSFWGTARRFLSRAGELFSDQAFVHWPPLA
jgi:hypothetical protein